MMILVLFVLIFLAAGGTLLAANLVLGRLVRPVLPSPEKAEVYECGEQPVGPAWVQFDLRFYVVALLFVIFDVELAFFFPWAVVFGSAVRLDDPNISYVEREAITEQLSPTTNNNRQQRQWLHTAAEVEREAARERNGAFEDPYAIRAEARAQGKAGKALAWVAFCDIMIFFGVLLVGFAYLWRRGDLEWVRSTAAQEAAGTNHAPQPPPNVPVAAP